MIPSRAWQSDMLPGLCPYIFPGIVTYLCSTDTQVRGVRHPKCGMERRRPGLYSLHLEIRHTSAVAGADDKTNMDAVIVFSGIVSMSGAIVLVTGIVNSGRASSTGEQQSLGSVSLDPRLQELGETQKGTIAPGSSTFRDSGSDCRPGGFHLIALLVDATLLGFLPHRHWPIEPLMRRG